jgi:CHAT domain-containing protein/Tfp pilus assembly protein PilF
VYAQAVVFATTAVLVADDGAQERAPAVDLESSGCLERPLVRGEEHRYQLALTAGEYANVVVEQKGIDAIVSVRDSSGTIIDDFQEEIRPDGEERVEIEADTAGTYTLAVKAADWAIAPGAYEIHLTGRRTATRADRTMQAARSLRTTARQLEQKGRFAEARPLLEQSLSLSESVRGPDDPYVATVVYDLAGVALERQDGAAAQALFERAMAMFAKAWGSDHPYFAMAQSRLGLVYHRAGQAQKAETLVRKALPVIERSLGADHPWFLQTQVTLANLRAGAGDLQQAEEIERRALATLEETHQTGTILEATLLNNLADIRRQQNDLTAAEPLFRRSLEIGEAVQGPDTLFVATAVQNLGIIARERKDYAGALSYYSRAISIRERLLGDDHPTLAGLLNNLANVYRSMGDDRKALETHFRALQLWERIVTPYSREILLSVGNIARTYAAVGDVGNALVYQRRADAILERQLELYLAGGSERQKLAFAHSMAERTDRTISLHLQQAIDDGDAASLAALVLLQRKGRVQDAMTDVFAAVRQRVTDPGDRALMDRFRETTSQLARLALNGRNAPATSAGPEPFAQIEARREQLEATLSERSAEFRAQMQPVTLEAVQAAIPGDAALLEFAVFRRFDPRAERNEEAYGPPHYAAYVIHKRAAPVGVDLGAVEDIDKAIVRLRDALRDPADAQVKARARALDERIMRPLRGSLNGATRLLISPDGGLNLVPFETLLDEHGRYLIERFATSYLTSGRDLLRMRTPRGVPGKPVIVADPLFGEPATETRLARTSTPALRPSVTIGADMSHLYFAPLSGSGAEARAIKALFPEATLLMGRRATKATLVHVNAPRILHIASHGFFLDDDREDTPADIAQNPLLRSGLALAGANLADGNRGDGILTALEAAGLDLWGTKLVTLSACDTGVGEVRDGEGVYGLRRAFILAGAETLVMSLWPVSDAIARDTMVGYYARLRGGLGRGDALRLAKLAVLKHPNLRHPYYWAGFIQSGDWTGLHSAR